MPGITGIEALHQIAADPALAAVRVLVLTTFDFDDYIADELSADASGFLLKDPDPDELVNAVRVLFRGDALLAPSVTRRVIRSFVSRAARLPPVTVTDQNLAALTA